MPYAAIVARASTDKQGDTVEHQIQMLTEFVNGLNRKIDNEEDKIILDKRFIYAGEGESAYKTTLLQRPEMKRLMEDIDKKLVDVVLFKGISRLARDAEEAFKTARKLKQKNIRVMSLEENYDSLHSDPFMFQIYAVIAQQESSKIAARVRLGNKQKARNGQWTTGIVPVGYTKVKDIADETLRNNLVAEGRHPHSLHPNDDRKLVEEIFDMFVNKNFGQRKIADTLNRRGIKTKFGNEYSPQLVKGITSNEVYIGNIVYGKTQYDYIDKDDGSEKKISKVIDMKRDDWVVVKNAHPPIIDIDTFYKAQIRNNENKKRGKTMNNAKYLLSGLLRCGNCGAPMTHSSRNKRLANGVTKKFRYYNCQSYMKKGKSVCAFSGVNADTLESFVFETVKKDFRRLFLSDVDGDILSKQSKDTASERIASLEKEIAERRKQIRQLTKDRDLYDTETYRELTVEINEEIKAIREEVGELRQQTNIDTERITSEELHEAVERIKDPEIDDDSTRDTFNRLIEKVEVYSKEYAKIIPK